MCLFITTNKYTVTLTETAEFFPSLQLKHIADIFINFSTYLRSVASSTVVFQSVYRGFASSWPHVSIFFFFFFVFFLIFFLSLLQCEFNITVSTQILLLCSSYDAQASSAISALILVQYTVKIPEIVLYHSVLTRCIMNRKLLVV